MVLRKVGAVTLTVLLIIGFSYSSMAGNIFSYDFDDCTESPSPDNCTGSFCNGELDAQCWGGDQKIDNFYGSKAFRVGHPGSGFFRFPYGFGGNREEIWVRSWVYFNENFQWRYNQYWKHMIFATPLQDHAVYVELLGAGNGSFNEPVNVARWAFQCQYDIRISGDGGDTWGAAVGEPSNTNSYIYPGKWYCVIVHLKASSAPGVGDGEADLYVYDESGKKIVSWDWLLKGSASGGATTSSPFKNVKHDFTRNGGGISPEHIEYRDDITYSTTPLGFVSRNGVSNVPPAPTNFRVVYGN